MTNPTYHPVAIRIPIYVGRYFFLYEYKSKYLRDDKYTANIYRGLQGIDRYSSYNVQGFPCYRKNL